MTLVEQSRQTADPEARQRLLDQARKELEQFAQANPESIAGAEAQMQLATVLLERGQQQIAQSASLPACTSLRRPTRRTSIVRPGNCLADARIMFQNAEAIYSTGELDKLPPTSTEDDKAAEGNRRQEYRARVAQLLFLAAQSQFEAARTYSPEAPEFKKLNEAAAKELSAVFEEFARVFPLPGLYARLYEGRCYQALGSYQLAPRAASKISARNPMCCRSFAN